MDMGDWAGAPDAGWKQEEDGVGDSQDGGMAIEESEGIPGRNGTDRTMELLVASSPLSPPILQHQTNPPSILA